MNQQNLFQTAITTVKLNTPTKINGVTVTVTYVGHQVKWGGMRPRYKVALSRGAVSRPFDFWRGVGEVNENFPIADFIEILGFDLATLADDDIADLGHDTIVAMQLQEHLIRRVFGTVDAFHEWSADYLYSVHEG